MTLTALFALTTLLAPAAPAAGAAPLAEDGKSPYVIVLPAAATPPQQRGATEIQTFVERMSGAKLPITDDAGPLPAHAILVGPTRHTPALAPGIDAATLGPEGFILRTTGPHLVILGGEPRGTLYGCTALLESLGVRFFTPTVTRAPTTRRLAVPLLDERPHRPAFEYREAYCTEAFDKDWAARLRLNGNAHRLDTSTGGKVRYSHFVHTFDDLIPLTLFAQHPEYFALVKGKRDNGYAQRCLSNPDVLRISTETVFKWIERDPTALIYSVSQNDCAKWCECDPCTAIANRYGGVQSGLYLWFVNQVAQAVEARHPDKLIDTLAYQFTEAAPTGIVPRPNVRVRLCPIAVCEAHPYEACTFPATVKFVEALRAWAKITDTLYIWHYNTNFAHYLLPFPDFAEFPSSIRLYQRSGVKGIFFEGDYAPGGGGSFAELQAYVMANLMWGPARDDRALVREWHDGVFGPAAAAPMLEYFDLLHAQVKPADKHFGIYAAPSKVPYLSPDIIARADVLFDRAEALASDAAQRDAIAKARLGLRYAKLTITPTTGDELTRFMADVRRFKIGQLREGPPTDKWEQDYRAKHAKRPGA